MGLSKENTLCQQDFSDDKSRRDPNKDHKNRKERGLARRTLVATRIPPKLMSKA